MALAVAKQTDENRHYGAQAMVLNGSDLEDFVSASNTIPCYQA